MTDGRQICKDEAPRVVVGQQRAEAIYRSVETTLLQMTEGKLFLTSSNVPVKVYDLNYLREKEAAGENVSERQVGLSHTTWTGGKIKHEVSLLSGQPIDDLRAVCAHEFTHLWLHENQPRERGLDPDTVEGICELVAWNLMEYERHPDVVRRIEANTYSKGKITELLDYQKRFGLANILDWAVRGREAALSEGVLLEFTGNWIDRSALSKAKAKSRSPATTLELKGIIGTGRNAMAMINNISLQAGESGSVKLSSGEVHVLCERIGRDFTIVLNRSSGKRERLVISVK